MDITTLLKLQDYINIESSHARFYEALANAAPTDEARNMLLELSKDEMNHVNILSSLYKEYTNYDYVPLTEPIYITETSYRQNLKKQILNEITNFRNYEKDFNQEEDNVRLRETFQDLKSDELVFVTTLLYLLEG